MAHVQTGSSPDTDSLKSTILPKLAEINTKVDSMRSSLESDPSNLTDKILQFALPAAAGLVVGKIMEVIWKKTTKDDTIPRGDDESTSIIKAVAFAAISGGVAAIVARLSTKGSKALVNHRQAKRTAA